MSSESRVIAVLERFLAWLGEYWASIVLPFVRALWTHCKLYERQNAEQSWRWHMRSYVPKVVYSMVAVFITWQVCDFFDQKTQVRLIAMAVLSVYPDFAMEYAVQKIKSFTDKLTGHCRRTVATP